MTKALVFFITLLPISCLAQFTITGRVLNQADKNPVANASVFLSNSSVGNKTTDDGSFKLTHAKPGKYDLVVSFVGFETYTGTITINDKNITLPDIEIKPQAILLSEVRIKPVIDTDREKYLLWFTEEFLGFSATAGECKILNPEILDFDYDKKNDVLTASTTDFLEIENDALGYKIRYLLTNFKLDNNPAAKFHLNYQGSVLFEAMKGTPSEEKRWQKHRQEVYEGSLMHFLRSALSDEITQEHFRALLVKRQADPARPGDSLIEARIKFYKNSKSTGANIKDSLSYWLKKEKLPRIIESMSATPLHMGDIIKPTDQQGLFAFSSGGISNSIFISYNKRDHFYLNTKPTELQMDDFGNNENTRLDFATDYAFFDRNGWVTNPNSLIFSGAWGRNRVAELLPVDYEVPDEVTQADSTAANKLIARLNKYNTTHITEKAYLQFDKPYYAAGDTIYFKAYITKGAKHELSDLSGVLHVDLINTVNKIDHIIKLQLDSGVAWGDFALPDSLPEGNYRVRAYTQWMKNDSTRDFFNKIIPVGSLINSPVPEGISKQPVQVLTNKADVQFFPEGGSMVTGIRSKIAFKAIGANGMGINVKGRIIDNKNNEITSFTSVRLGMGYFYLMPEEGKTYKAQLTFANGEQSTVNLPDAVTDGIVLSINNDELPKASVRIRANKAYFREYKDKDLTLLIYSGGEATTVVRTLDSATVSFDILKRHLQTGIATITLLSPSGEPLCERLLFVQNYGQLNIAVSSNKTTYSKREKVKIGLQVTDRAGDAVAGHFSVSVTDESKVPENVLNENTILSYLLLTSDLKGYIEQPNGYFTDTSANAPKYMDILMLTQGYRHFTWKQVLENAPLTYQSEKALEISGTVKNLFDKPIAGGTVSLIQQKGGPLLSSITDDKGVFHFSNLIFNDTTHFVLSAVNAKGKNLTKIALLNEIPEPLLSATQLQNMQTFSDTAIAAYLENTKNSRNELANYGRGKGKLLKEVEIRARKIDSLTISKNYGIADQVIRGDQIEYGGQLAVRLMVKLNGVHFVPRGGIFIPVLNRNAPFIIPMVIIVNDEEMPADFDISSINTGSIEKVELMKNATVSERGVLIITTTFGTQAKDIASTGVLPITPMGFYKAREFYSPKYNNPALTTKQRDLRSTIYWKPEIVTDKDGNASFDFFNADGEGSYKVVVEGIDDKGNLGRQVYRYKVE